MTEYWRSKKHLQEEALKKALVILGEHFDTAQVIISTKALNDRADETTMFWDGVGNYHARLFATRHFLKCAESDYSIQYFNDDEGDLDELSR